MPRSGSGGRLPPSTSPGDLSRLGATRRRREPASGAPYLVPATLALAAAVGTFLMWGRLASCAPAISGSEAQIRAALANQQRAHLDDVYGFRSGGTVELAPVRFAEVVPSVEGGRATVVAMVDAEGRVTWRGEAARLSYLGRERFHMRPCSIALWCGEGDQFDRLRGVLLALFRRHDAALAGDAAALERLAGAAYADRGEDRAAALARVAQELEHGGGRARVEAWQVRVDRDSAEVGEDAELTPAGGPPRRERRLYRLAREGERWVFTGGL